MTPQKINLSDKFARISQYWHPGVIGELNGQQVKLAKFKGRFDWHQHEEEDEMFLVIDGKIRIGLSDRTIELEAGEMLIVPRGILHQPEAEEEAHVMLFEPASTLNTGNTKSGRTVKDPGFL